MSDTDEQRDSHLTRKQFFGALIGAPIAVTAAASVKPRLEPLTVKLGLDTSAFQQAMAKIQSDLLLHGNARWHIPQRNGKSAFVAHLVRSSYTG